MDSRIEAIAAEARVPASEAELLKFARGNWQESCVRGNTITFGKLQGKAADYQDSYRRSIQGMLARIAGAGYIVEPIYGPRGGRPREWRVYRQ